MTTEANELIREVLGRIDDLDRKITTVVTEQAIRDERYDVLATNFKERTKHIEELMGVLNQGKTAAKLVAALIAFLAGLGATWDWIIAHIRIL
jgi:DNA-binding sugar fermentation-stimulating protein